MSTSMLEIATKERDMLKAQLAAVENVIAAYGGKAKVAKPQKGQLIKELARECVRFNKGQAKAPIIHSYLESKGIKISLATLSAYLSSWKNDFKADRKNGWSIKGETPKEE